MDNMEYRGLMNTLTGIRNTLDAILVEIKSNDDLPTPTEEIEGEAPKQDECLTVIEACSYTGVCAATFYRWVKQGLIHPINRYGVKTYIRSDIDTCLKYKKPNHKEI